MSDGSTPSLSQASTRGFLVLLLSSRMLHETTVWNASRPDNLVYVAAVFLPVVFRFHIAAVMLALGVNLYSAIDELPHLPNHSLLGLWVTAATLLLTLRARFSRQSLAALTPFCGALLALMYLWAGFHKLNTDFFVHESTCVDVFSGLVWTALGVGEFPSLSPGLLLTLGGLTVFLELAAGALLFSRRTRWLGAMCAFLLHVPLSYAGFYNFSALAFAVLYLVLQPLRDEADESSARLLYGVPAAVFRYALWNSAGALLGLLLTALRSDGSVQPPGASSALFENVSDGRITALRATILLLSGAALLWPLLHSGQRHRMRARLIPTRPWGYLGFALLCLYAGSPYLGLSTAGSFSMFSNLRTEGTRSNHLLLSRNPFKLFGYQEDLVQLIDFGDALLSLDPEFEQPRYEKDQLIYQSVNLLRLRYLLHTMRAADPKQKLPMTLRYRGQTREFANILDEPFFAPKTLGLLNYALTFRSVDTAEHQSCKW